MDVNDRHNFQRDYYNISNTTITEDGNRVETIGMSVIFYAIGFIVKFDKSLIIFVVHSEPINIFSRNEQESYDCKTFSSLFSNFLLKLKGTCCIFQYHQLENNQYSPRKLLCDQESFLNQAWII